MATRLDQIHPRMMSIESLLDSIDAGEIALPEFQRDFDWEEREVRALLVTVLAGWPAGSLLMLSGGVEYLALRSFEGAPKLQDQPEFVVLDGQQRLTALYHGLRNRGPSVYYIKVSALGHGTVDELEDALLFMRRDEWEKTLMQPAEQLAASVIPLYALRSAIDYFAWRDQIVAVADADARDQTHDRLTEIYRKQLATVHSYDLPVVVVPAKTRPAAIARIFERVNRTGMKLEAFDLMVARSYEPGWNLRERYEQARADSSWIDEYLGDDGFPILQLIALRAVKDIRESAVIDLPGAVVRREWEEAALAMSSGLEFLGSHGGVVAPDWLPYRAMAIVVGGVAREGGIERLTDRLVAWYWAAAFGQAYNVASNTRAVSDYQRLLRGTQQPDPVPLDTLISATRRRDAAAWRALLCALAVNQARDIDTGAELIPVRDAEPFGAASQPRAVSLLPRVPDADEEDRPERRILGYILSAARTLRRLQNGQWLAEYAQEPPSPELLASQMLPTEVDLPALIVDWQQFLDERAEHLAAFLRGRGVRTVRLAADLQAQAER